MWSSPVLFQTLAVAGMLLSLLAIRIVEHAQKSSRFVAWCDINKHMSCTKALTSPHGRIFRIHNAWIGLFYYLLLFLLASRAQYSFLLVLSSLAALASLYLFYVAYVEMRNACPLCTAIYIINGLLLFFSYSAVF